MVTCIFMYFWQQYNNFKKFKSSIEIYPININPIEVYPIEAYLIGKGAVEVCGCSRQNSTVTTNKGFCDCILCICARLEIQTLTFWEAVIRMGGGGTTSDSTKRFRLDWMRSCSCVRILYRKSTAPENYCCGSGQFRIGSGSVPDPSTCWCFGKLLHSNSTERSHICSYIKPYFARASFSLKSTWNNSNSWEGYDMAKRWVRCKSTWKELYPKCL